MFSRHYLKSRATQFAIEYDQFSQQEEETTSSTPIDASITRLHDLRVFPSKNSMIPGSVPSGQKRQKYRVQRSLSESDETTTRKDEHFSKAYKALKNTIKTFGANEEKSLKFRRVRTEGTIVKTISLKIPDLTGSRDRSTEFNIFTHTDEEINRDAFSDDEK